jgi:hypothetical protein
MSRKSSASSDSLDLLLDTICNTFGGVLFIAMLVIILLNMSSEQAASDPPTPDAQTQLATAQAEMVRAQAELDRLRRAAAEQTKLASQFSDPKVKSLLSTMTASQQQVTAAAATTAANLQAAADKQRDINQMASDLAALEAALTRAQEQLAAVESQLKQEKELRTRTVSLPKQKQTTKDQVAFLLQGGKLYAYMRIGSTGVPEHDTRDTKVVTVGMESFVEPVQSGGAAVNPAGDTSGAIAQKFKGWQPAQHFIAVAVWPDSFEHFSAVRQVLVERGFEYQLLPMPDGSRVPITDAPVNRLVQ